VNVIDKDLSSKCNQASGEAQTEEKAEVILPEVSECLRKIEANLKRLRTETQVSVTPETASAMLPENIEMYTHQKFGLKVSWRPGEMEEEAGGVKKPKKLKCSIANLQGEAWAEEDVEMESGHVIIDKAKILPGATFRVVLATADAVVSDRLLTFPPDSPTDVVIAPGKPSSSSSSSHSASRFLRWRHPRGKHDKYRLTFRQDPAAGGDADVGAAGDPLKTPLATFEISGDADSFAVDAELTRMLRRRLMEEKLTDYGAGDGVKDKSTMKTTMRRKKGGEAVIAEVRTVAFPEDPSGKERTQAVCSDANCVSFRLSPTLEEIRPRKSADVAETWQWTPATMLGAVGVLAGAAALYLSVVKEDVIRPPPIADAKVIIKGIRMSGKNPTP